MVDLDQSSRPVVRLVQEPLDLLVHQLRGMLADVAPLAQLATQEYFVVTFAHRHQPYLLTHAELGDHSAGDGRRALDVVASPGRDPLWPEDHLLGDPAPVEHGELPFKPLLRIGVPVLFRQARGDPEGATTWNDGHLVQGVHSGHT